MFPIRDHNPSGRTPWVSWTLIAVNIAIFAAYWTSIDSEMGLARFFFAWGVVPGRITQGEGWATLVTSMFLHGGWMHLLGNMLYLWIFGDNVEDEMGHATFLGFYLAGGFAAAAAQIMADPGSPVPMVGASGAIAAVLGAYLLLYPRARVDILIIIVIIFKVIPIPAWIVLGIWMALQLFNGLATPTDEGGVAYWAHAGGFLAGMVLALPLWIARGGPGFWARTHGAPPNPEAQYRLSPSRVPKIPRR